MVEFVEVIVFLERGSEVFVVDEEWFFGVEVEVKCFELVEFYVFYGVYFEVVGV